MRLLIGQPVTADHIESLGTAWDPRRAVQFYNALIVDCLDIGTKGRVLGVGLSERINVSDGGIDAEADVELAPDQVEDTALGLVGPGWTVYQLKHRDRNRANRPRLVKELARELKAALVKIRAKRGRFPSRYVLLTNLQVDQEGSAQRDRLTGAIREGAPDARTQVVVADAGIIASLLNNRPHLKAVFFDREAFCTWDIAYDQHMQTWPEQCPVEFVGRDKDKEKLVAAFSDPCRPNVVVAGPSEIGKTRLILEATRDLSHRVAWCQSTAEFSQADVQRLASPKGTTLVVVEHPDRDRLEPLLRAAAAAEGVQLVVETQVRPGSPDPNLAQLVKLQKLSDVESSELLKRMGSGLGFLGQCWAGNLAEGIPGWLVRTAALGGRFRDEGDDTREQLVAREWETVKKHLTGREPESLKALSVLPQVGVEGDRRAELEGVARSLRLSVSEVLEDIQTLKHTGHLVVRGPYVEVVPQALAVMLAGHMLTGGPERLSGLCLALPSRAQRRFFRRLAQLDCPEARQMRMDLFADRSLFGSVEGLDRAGWLLQELAPVHPDEAAECLSRLIEPMSLDQRRELAGQARRRTVWTLEELVQHEGTFGPAARLLALLAEAENEDYGNSATNIFVEVFHFRHPYIAANYQDRVQTLTELARSGSPRLEALVACAAGHAFQVPTSFLLSRNDMLSPREPVGGVTTVGDVRWYAEALSDIEDGVIATGDDERVAQGGIGLAELVKGAFHLGAADAVLRRLEERIPVLRQSVTATQLTEIVRNLRWVRQRACELRPKLEGAEEGQQVASLICRLDRCIDRIEGDTFADRVRIWTGPLSRERTIEMTGADAQRQMSNELCALASEACEDPRKVDDDLLDWLTSDEAANGPALFSEVGAIDRGGAWLARIERIAQQPAGAGAFAGYVGGWHREDSGAADAYLEREAAGDEVCGQAVLHASLWLPGTSAAADRVVGLVERGRLDGDLCLTVLSFGPWADGLEDQAVAGLIEGCCPRGVYGSGAVRFLGMRKHRHAPLSGQIKELAWRVVESLTPHSGQDGLHDWDDIAGHLSRADPERGLALLGAVLRRPRSEPTDLWSPVTHGMPNGLWDVLLRWNRPRTIRTALQAATDAGDVWYTIVWDLQGVVSPGEDAAVLDQSIDEQTDRSHAAMLVAECLDAEKPGFWAYAASLIDRFPDDERLRRRLGGRLRATGVVSGSFVPVFERRAQQAKQMADRADLSQQVRIWARRMAESLGAEAGSHLIWEYDEDVDDLRAAVEDKQSPDRLWAIERILRVGSIETVQRLLTVEDIVEALPQIKLSPEKRKAYEALVALWRSDGG